MNIVIVGGGNASISILDQFSLFDAHQITGVADINMEAPGMVRAAELGIHTTTDMMALINDPSTDIVFELTGSEKVQGLIRENLSSNQSMISSEGAWIMCELIEAQNQHKREIASAVTSEFAAATDRIESTVKTMKRSSRELKGLLKQGRMISINANIEAARIGEMGKAFSVVVTAIHDLVANMQSALGSIDEAAESTQVTIKALHKAEKHLAESFDQ